MTLPLKWIGRLAVLALVLGLVVALVVTTRRHRDAAFRADSLQAVADTQRIVLGATVRRAVQSELERDALSKALKAKPKVRIVTRVEFDTVRVDSASGSPVTEVEGVRRATLDLRQEPVTLHTEAELPAPPAPARFLNTRIGIDPFTIIPRVECSTEKFDGLRRATVALDSLPDWAHVTIRSGQTDRAVCNPQIGFAAGFKLPWWLSLLVAGVGFAAGVVLSP